MGAKRSFAAVAMSALALTGAIWAQDPYDHESWKNGYFHTSTYGGFLSGGLYSLNVNHYTGGYNLHIPVLSLPGRAGHDVDLVLTYNSRQFYLEPAWKRLGGEDAYGYWARSYLSGPHMGRWKLNVWPSLREGVPGSLYYFTTPDGAVHRLHKYRSGAWRVATDGTDIAYNPTTMRVAYPSGEFFDFGEYDAQNRVHHVDRNGNRITYQFESYTAYSKRPAKIVDTLGREIHLIYAAANPTFVSEIRVANHAGVDLSYTFEYEYMDASFLYAYEQWGWPITLRRYYNCFNTVESRVLTGIGLPNGTGYTITYATDRLRLANNQWVDLTTYQLDAVTLPTGARLEFGYAVPPKPQNPQTSPTSWDEMEMYSERLSRRVGRVTVDPLDERPRSTYFSYQRDAANHITQTTETRADGSKVVTSWYGSSSVDKFLRSRQYTYDTDGTKLLQDVLSTWTGTPYGKRSSNTEVYTYTTDGPAVWASSGVTRVYNDDGRVVSETLSNQGPARFRRYWEYEPFDTTRYLSKLAREDRTRIRKISNHPYYEEYVVSSVRYQYDQFPPTNRTGVVQRDPGFGSGFANRGNPTTARVFYPAENRFLETTTRYDILGNVVQQTDPAGRVTTTEYAAAHQFAYPIRVTNPAGHQIQTSYNFRTGLPTASTDANGQTTVFAYDAYNRLVREDYPDGGWRTLAYHDTWNQGAYRMRVDTRRAIDAAASAGRSDYYDGVGRLIRTEIEQASGPAARVDREYDGCGSCSGGAARVSTPYPAGGEPAGWAETIHDGLGRVRKVIPPDGTAVSNFTEYRHRRMIYTNGFGWMVGTLDPTGRRRVHVYDVASGELVQVRENADSSFNSSTVTDYRISPDGSDYLTTGEQRNGQPIRYAKWQVQTITQGVQTRTLRSDNLGRLVSKTHPENGTTTYAWDDAGNLVLKTDARGVTTGTTYDVLGRPTLVQYSDSTPSVTRAYDLGAYGIGRLHSVSNAHATSVYTYDEMGRIVREDKTIGGTPFATQTAYNLAGRAVARTLPNGTAIAYEYDAAGQLEAILSDWVDAQHPAVLASNFAWDPAGRWTSVEFGNGRTSTRTYNVGGQLKRLSHGTVANPTSLVDYQYDYGEYSANNGLIKKIVNYRDRTKDVQFTYDAFYRLSAAETAGSHWGLAWTYDRYGNQLTQTVSKGTGPTRSLTVNAATNRVSGWTYDAAGNTTNDGLRTYAYDANNRITQAGGGSSVYRYDGDGNRVMKVAGGKTGIPACRRGVRRDRGVSKTPPRPAADRLEARLEARRPAFSAARRSGWSTGRTRPGFTTTTTWGRRRR